MEKSRATAFDVSRSGCLFATLSVCVDRSFHNLTRDHSESEMEHITRINENDVLLGRGGRNHEHSGNNQLRRIAHSRVRDYSAASKKQKAVISRYVTFQLLLSAFSCTYDYNADPTSTPIPIYTERFCIRYKPWIPLVVFFSKITLHMSGM